MIYFLRTILEILQFSVLAEGLIGVIVNPLPEMSKRKIEKNYSSAILWEEAKQFR